ncbi:hypothetical protein IJJ97_07660 [bacterium]|nr:hypothetical protein [bacterium]
MRLVSVLLLFIVICFLGGCIEASDNLSILKDGSCVDSRVLKIKTGLMSKIDSGEFKAPEKYGYEVRICTEKDQSIIYVTKRYDKVEEYYNTDMKIDENGASFGNGEIEGKFKYINLFFFKQMTITEKIKPSGVLISDSSTFSDKFITEVRTIRMPYKITSSNADIVDDKENIAKWTIDSQRRNSEYVREVTCTDINYVFIIIMISLIATVLIIMQQKNANNV